MSSSGSSGTRLETPVETRGSRRDPHVLCWLRVPRGVLEAWNFRFLAVSEVSSKNPMSRSSDYAAAWKKFFNDNATPTAQQILQHAADLAKKFNFDWP